MKKLIFFILFPIISYGMSIDEAVEKAVNNNLSLKQYRLNIKKAEYQIKEDINLFMPELFTNFSFTSMKDTPYQKLPAGVLPFPFSFKQTEKDFRYFDIGINYYLFTGFSRFEKLKISKFEKKASNELYLEELNRIKTEVKKAYIDVLMASSVVHIYKKQLEAVEKHLYRVKEFYRQGLVAKIDILQTKVRMSQIKRDLRKAEGDLKIAKARLKNLINEKLDTDFEIEPVKLDIPKELNLSNLYKKALINRHLIKVVDIKSKQLKKVEKIELSEFYPKVYAQAKYFYTNEYPYLDPKENYALTVGITWKFQSLKPYYSYLKQKIEHKKTKLKLEQIKNDIKLQVKAAYERFLTAKENLKVAQDSLSEAEEYYRLTVEQFKNQLASTTDVLDAESMLTSAKKGREISYYRLLKAYFDLQEAVGGSI
ncbi:TolC family protein [Persephonella sp.]|uniref:TolC family protein n=3 Tax=Persephonella sp. TaxID=2060922 RepID=UPI002607E93E|nr:TolC family protein [Persephonella sp.]